MKQLKNWIICLCIVTSFGSAFAQSNASPEGEGTVKSEDLIYSVNRVPERTFETARAVQVITREDIWRKNAMTLSEILSTEPGFVKYRPTANVATAVYRGLLGRQILVLIDGVKINNAIYGDIPNLDLIDINQIERIEIVRGVVSVLGTEALGGVVNIITKKGPDSKETIGGSVGLRYSSAANAFAAPINVGGQTAKMRWHLGMNYMDVGESRGGDGVGVQPLTDYTHSAGDVSLDFFVSADKTVSFSYRASDQQEVKSPTTMLSGLSVRTMSDPNRVQLATLSYHDLTDRRWFDSFRATGYFNVQDTGVRDTRTRTPHLETIVRETDRLAGFNMELGSFFGSHHLVYGFDLAHDQIASSNHDHNSTTGADTWRRGVYTDGATYQTAGIYAQDNFSLSQWLTITAGLRYGIFETKGAETLPVIGAVELDSRKSDLTGALNVVFHVTPTLNVVGSAMRGFRAPNVRDISRFSASTTTIEIPNQNAAAERMTSYEAGVKYAGSMISGSAFYFNNRLSNLLVVASGTFRGLSFLDVNGNGTRDAGELAVRQNQNIGTALIKGYEADIRFTPRSWLTLSANYSKSDATTRDALAPTLVQRVPPPYGGAAIRLNGGGRYTPWVEVIYSFTQSFTANGVVLSPEFNEYAMRVGASISDRFRVVVSGENLNDQRYIARFAAFAYPGRRVAVATEYRF